jgi:hypothetical protein
MEANNTLRSDRLARNLAIGGLLAAMLRLLPMQSAHFPRRFIGSSSSNHS